MKRTVIITGAGKGIGFSLCKKFSNEGWHTIGLSRNVDSLLGLEGVKCISADLSDEKGISKVINELYAEPASDFLAVIHCAGILINRRFEEITNAEIDEIFNINYLAPLKLTRGFMPIMRSSSKVHNLFIGSMGGFQGSSKYPGLSVYSSIKSAVSTLGECLAEEYKHTHIRFNTLALGAVDTEMLQEAFPGFVSGVSPEAISNWIYTFCLESYDLINGKVIPVAGSNP
jgi:NAD(P)-dependent dehydrogenase (short-subunit alcohol dehydrogenase family)